jgi:16S rRNA (guanine527-N7)-methyltransferase
MKKTTSVALSDALVLNHLSIAALEQAAMLKYLDLIQTWNRVFNLTAITDLPEMIYLHLIDSLLVQPYLSGARFLDVGSGAGLPGIPLAIAHPEHQWVLLDKNSKKTRFITQVVAELDLTNVEVIHSRVEDFHPARGFDSILSRAFGTLALFMETTHHLLAPRGIWIAMKGKYPEEELRDIPKAFSLEQVASLTMKGRALDRHLVCLRRAARG